MAEPRPVDAAARQRFLLRVQPGLGAGGRRRTAACASECRTAGCRRSSSTRTGSECGARHCSCWLSERGLPACNGRCAAASQHAAAPAAAASLEPGPARATPRSGFVSESGSFRITWKAQNQDNARPGAFQLTLRSGISGRPMKVIADHQGAGGGSVEFGDDPRLYEFLVESSRHRLVDLRAGNVRAAK